MVDYPLVNQHNYGKSPFSMGKSTISMAIFNPTFDHGTTGHNPHLKKAPRGSQSQKRIGDVCESPFCVYI